MLKFKKDEEEVWDAEKVRNMSDEEVKNAMASSKQTIAEHEKWDQLRPKLIWGGIALVVIIYFLVG